MNIYVAGSWKARDYVRQVTKYLNANGLTTVHRWTEQDENETKAACAQNDLDDLVRADTVLLLNTSPSTGGGMHFETGYAYSKGYRVIVIGERTSVFHYLPHVHFFLTPQEFVKWAAKIPRKAAKA